MDAANETTGIGNFIDRLRHRSVAAVSAGAVAASLFASNIAQAQAPVAFTHEQCKGIAGVIAMVYQNRDPSNRKPPLSDEFKASVRRWLNVPHFTCDGPTNISTPTAADVATFNTIRGELLGANISLERAGLRSVDPRRAGEPPAVVRANAPTR